MRLGLSSYTYTWAVGVPGSEPDRPMSALDLLERARELDVPVVQVGDNLPLHRLAPDALEEFAVRARDLGLAIEVGTRGISPANVQRYLQIAGRVGSPLVRVVLDSPGHHPTPDAAVELLRGHRQAFDRAGVVLAVENHDRFPAAVLRRVVRELGSGWVGICLDTVNSFGALEGPRVVVQTLAELTVNVHVKDFRITRLPHLMGFTVEGRPAGAGMLDVPWLFAELAAAGRSDLSAILELWTPPASSVPETIATEHRWARESVAYLTALVRRGA